MNTQDTIQISEDKASVMVTPAPVIPPAVKTPIDQYVRQLLNRKNGLQKQLDAVEALLAQISGSGIDVVAISQPRKPTPIAVAPVETPVLSTDSQTS